MADGDNPFENLLDINEVAQEIGIHPQSVRRLIKQNELPARYHRGKYFIDRDQLQMFKANYNPRPGRKRSAKLL